MDPKWYYNYAWSSRKTFKSFNHEEASEHWNWQNILVGDETGEGTF